MTGVSSKASSKRSLDCKIWLTPLPALQPSGTPAVGPSGPPALRPSALPASRPFCALARDLDQARFQMECSSSFLSVLLRESMSAPQSCRLRRSHSKTKLKNCYLESLALHKTKVFLWPEFLRQRIISSIFVILVLLWIDIFRSA